MSYDDPAADVHALKIDSSGAANSALAKETG